MKKLFIPDLHLKSVYLISTQVLKENNIHGIIIDIDNTLVAWEVAHADNRTIEFIEQLLNQGFRICILSNNTKKRVEKFNKKLNLPAIYKAGKPKKSSYRKAMKLLETEARNTAVIGDQVFTDILGGNRLGLFTILITPISTKEFIGTRLVRKLERLVIKQLKKMQ